MQSEALNRPQDLETQARNMPPLRGEPFHRHGTGQRTAGSLFLGCLRRLIAVTMLLGLSPVFLVIGLLIAVIDGRPIFFKHYRVGLHGKMFGCYKFRTMHVDAQAKLMHLLETDPSAREEWLVNQKLSQDPRVTTIGRFLRKSSLDELPQLWNIVRGDMCFIGPRPVTVDELARYGGDRWFYASVLPGVTGLWQVNGRNKTSYERRVALDRHYVEFRSLRLDLWILIKTFWVVAKRDGAA
jgi:exopolysaccharide production protein ExoY